jgi:MEDS: MEthanogen/methylotroph, DcmR Sensory domain
MTTASWESLLDSPVSCDHFVQLYQDDAFLARAVFHYLGAGLAKNEAIIVIATPAHRALFTDRLAAAGFDVPELVRQLLVLDAEECLAQFMVNGMPDRVAFATLVKGALEQPPAAGFTSIRLYGEMVDLLWEQSLAATLELEALWKELLADQGVSLLCAYRIDNFNRNVHRGILHRLCHCHSHVIPVEDYERFDRAVARAYAEVFGTAGDGETLQALLALREVSSNLADSVLDRARLHYAGSIPLPAGR